MHKTYRSTFARFFVVLATLSLSACGGGGSNGSADRAQASSQQINLVLTTQSPGVQRFGEFRPVESQLSHSKAALRSVGAGIDRFVFPASVATPGYYRLHVWTPQTSTPLGSARLLIRAAGSSEGLNLDQTRNQGQWVLVGVYRFDSGASNSVELADQGAGSILVDSIRLEYAGSTRPALTIESLALPIAHKDLEYRSEIQVIGGIKPYTWGITSGELPPGFALVEGRIEGRAAIAGSFTAQIEVRDATGVSASKAFDIAVLDSDGGPSEGQPLDFTSRAHPADGTSVGTPPNLGGLVGVLAAMPEGNWAKVNLNLFSDAWTPGQLRPHPGHPGMVIGAWSSFAWDPNRGDLWIFGGGHANYAGNEVYRWRGTTRMWERASLPSAVTQDALGNWMAVDGPDAAPASAHTYDNTMFLPVIDRLLILGGAAFNNGGHYYRQATATTSRRTGPYLFDPNRADANKVGGTTGSHVQRFAPYPEVVGGNMWVNRDMYINMPGSPPLPQNYVNGCTAYDREGGKDVAYVAANPGYGTNLDLFKYTVNSLTNPALDTWVRLGRYWGSPTSQAGCGYDPVRKVFVRVGSNSYPFVYWDLNTPGEFNNDRLVTPSDPSGQYAAFLAAGSPRMNDCGLDFDPVRAKFALWCGDGAVWWLTPPATITPSGWTISKQPAPSGAVPNGDFGVGILGKWKYIHNLDAYMGLQDLNQGNVWLYKPIGWVNPGGGNAAPSASIAQPASGTSFVATANVLIQANASDSDGVVTKVEFFADGTRLGEDTAAPYEFPWANPAVGPHNLTVIATDDDGASTTSAPVSISVVANAAPSVAVTAPSNGASFAAGSNIDIDATASDSDGSVAKVEFYQGGSKLGEDTNAPYSFPWSSVPSGSYSLTAVATDNLGAQTTSNPVSITVDAPLNVPPSVAITAPNNGASFSAGATVNIAANASDTDGTIIRVEFHRGTTILGEDTSAPYEFPWTSVPAGSHSLTAVAFDNLGAQTTSAPVNITVTGSASTTVSLQDGVAAYTGTRDTYLSTYHKTLPLGSITSIANQGLSYTGLVRFAIFQSQGGPVPDGATITSARLELYKYTYYSTTYRLHRLLQDWTEASATWNRRGAGIFWVVPGALGAGSDYATVADAEGLAAWAPSWVNFDVTAAVQQMATGQPNFGWTLIQSAGDGVNLKKFYAREFAANPSLRPKLTITYN